MPRLLVCEAPKVLQASLVPVAALDVKTAEIIIMLIAITIVVVAADVAAANSAIIAMLVGQAIMEAKEADKTAILVHSRHARRALAHKSLCRVLAQAEASRIQVTLGLFKAPSPLIGIVEIAATEAITMVAQAIVLSHPCEQLV
jgi:hypothetical protein